MKAIDELKQAMLVLEAQRSQLGDGVVDTALASLRERIASLEEYQPASRERRLVSVMFLDIVSSTRLSQGLEPEEIQEVFGGALHQLSRPVEDYGGQVVQLMGDGFVAVFGLKQARENDARQAVRAGLDILAEVRICAEDLNQRFNLPGFNVRLGINTGRVVAGRFSRAESPLMGLTVTLAARIEQAAEPGTLFISQFTFQHVRGAFEVEVLPPVEAKGFSKPVIIYRVLSARPRTFHTFTRGVQGIETRLVGREAELCQLQQAFTHVTQSRQTRLVTVIGEAGIGKSRLLYEFDRWLANLPFPVVAFKARTSPQLAGVPFSLLREMISYRLNLLTTDPVETTRRCLVQGLSEAFEDEAEMKAHFIGTLLGFDFSGSPYLKGVENDPRQLNERGQLYLSQYFFWVANKTAAEDRAGTIFMLDDIHWADAPSVNFIVQLVRQHPQLCLLVICLGRPLLSESANGIEREETNPIQLLTRLDLLPCSQLLTLDPLSSRASKDLFEEILQNVSPLPGKLRQQILDKAEGNPFYIEEFIQALIDARLIYTQRSGESWTVDVGRLGDLQLPDTLIALLEARLDNLRPSQRALLQQAAVIGQVFWRSSLQAVHGQRPVSDDVLTTLTQRGYIYPQEPSTFEGTEEYRFHHALLRDVAYQALRKPDRKAHHNQVAGWLIKTTQDSGRAGEYAAVIAEHYEQAGEPTMAADWFIQAGSRARNQGAPAESREFFNRALGLIPTEVGPLFTPEEQERHWSALLGRDEVLGILGDTEGRMADDQALVAMAQWMQDDNRLAEACFRQGYYLGVSGQYRQEKEVYNRGLEAARRSNNRRCEAMILGLKVFCEVHLGELGAARGTSAAALQAAYDLGDDEIIARNLTNASTYYTEAGDMARAAQMLEHQLEINRRNSNHEGEVIGLSNLGYVYVLLGLPEQAIVPLNRSLELAKDLGMFNFYSYARLNLALAHLRAGDPVLALDELEQCLPDLLLMNNVLDYGTGLTYRALALEQNGQVGEALACFEQAVTSLKEIGTVGNLYDAEAGLARCLLKLQHFGEAYDHALPLWHHLQQQAGARMEFPVQAYETCADVFAAVGQERLARRAVGAGYGELLVRAGKISLPEWRRSFMEKVHEHLRIRERWQQIIDKNKF